MTKYKNSDSILRLVPRLSITIFLTFFLTACSEESTDKLYVGTNIWPGYEPGYIAETQGFYRTGAIQMRQFSSATEVLRAFRNESIHVAALTLDEALQLAQNDKEVVVFLVADISDGADVIMAKPYISQVSELKGRTVAAEGSALGAFVISRALQLAEVNPNDLNIVSMTVDESVVAYEEGRVDAVVTFEPFRSMLLRQGAIEIFTSKEIPNEIVDVLVTKRSIIDAHEDALRDLTQGWIAAVELIQKQPEVTSPLIAQRLELEVGEVASAFDGLVLPGKEQNQAMLGGETPNLTQVAAVLKQILEDKKLLTNEVDIHNLIDSRLIR